MTAAGFQPKKQQASKRYRPNRSPLPNSKVRLLPEASVGQGLDWPALLQDLIHFAQYQIDRLRWRYHHGGVLPEGFDAQSLASEAIHQFFLSISDFSADAEKNGG